MTKAVKLYADAEKARKYRNHQRKVNYDAMPGKPGVVGTRWTPEHKRMVVEHIMPDRELAEKIGRSTRAIQAMRTKIRNGSVKLEADVPRSEASQQWFLTDLEMSAQKDTARVHMPGEGDVEISLPTMRGEER